MDRIARIVPCLWFDHQAEEAATFYVSVAMDPMLRMKKIDIAELERATAEEPVGGRP